MKVLKKGRPQKGWAKEFVCSGQGNSGGGCGAELLVEMDDLFRTTNTDYCGDCDIFITFKCPDCGVLTDIPTKYWPFSISAVPSRAVWEDIHKSKKVLHG